MTAICRYIKKKSIINIFDYNSTKTWDNCISTYWVQNKNQVIENFEYFDVFYPVLDKLVKEKKKM